MGRMVVSTQDQFDFVKPLFESASSYRLFRRYFQFDPAAKISRTTMLLEEALPRAGPGGDRSLIFRHAIVEGASAEEINRTARHLSPHAEHDADLFIALYCGYCRLAQT